VDPTQIRVYADQGVDGESLRQLLTCLNETIDPAQHQVATLDAHTLLSTPWEASTALLIMPGGRDRYYHQLLDGPGTNCLRAFVAQGGGYLGLCAGAYFACATIEFEKGAPLEICEQRALQFFPGLARGPAYGPGLYDYDSFKGARAALVACRGQLHRLYFNGGCSFHLPEPLPGIEVIGSYSDLPGTPPAILSIPYQRGRVVLSGVHFEYSPNTLSRGDAYLEPVIALLAAHEPARKALCREIFSMFGIVVKKS